MMERLERSKAADAAKDRVATMRRTNPSNEKTTVLTLAPTCANNSYVSLIDMWWTLNLEGI